MTDLNLVANGSASTSSRSGSWWAKLIAIVAVINLFLVLFDLSYIPWRDLYLRQFPSIVAFYDPFKGIEPHRVAQKYLNTVDELERQLHQVEPQTPEVENLLADLRHQSVITIDENPFTIASEVGNFAKLKRRMRQHLGTDSAKEAFKKFWSSDYLANAGVYEALSFFDDKIKPLLANNYYRDINERGKFVDKFWQIDIFFLGFFGLDFLIGTFLRSFRQPKISWLDACVQRWYDLFLFLPFWRWLRVIPVTVRLHQARIVNLERILANLTYEPVAYLAEKVSKFVLVRFINQAQQAIEQGDVAQFLFKQRKYLTVNDINEQQVIGDRLMQLLVHKVLPQVQPDMESLLHYGIQGAFKQSNFYRDFQKIPVIGNMPAEAIEQLAHNLTKGVVEGLASSYSDPKGREIFDRFTQDFNAALRRELQNNHTLPELEYLISQWLEEMKLNYVQRVTDLDPKLTLAEVEHLHQAAKQSSIPS